jgi:protein-disulfide isomerase
MKRFCTGLMLTLSAAAAVGLARQTGDPIAAGVPSYRVKGPSWARVTVVVFSDFQCPGCAKAEPAVEALVQRHADRVRLAFRHNPLQMHKWSVFAARAAEAAGAQGKFWEYHTLLFARQKDWGESTDPVPLFIGYARESGLDAARFERDVRGARWDALVRADAEAAKAAGVESTPTIFIGDRRLVGVKQLEADGERLMEEALK